MSAYVVTTTHRHCVDCNGLIEPALSRAKVATRNALAYHRGEHGVSVLRQSTSERREELGMAEKIFREPATEIELGIIVAPGEFPRITVEDRDEARALVKALTKAGVAVNLREVRA